MDEIRGILEEVIFRNEENGFTIGRVNTKGILVTVTGTMPAPLTGTTYIFTGGKRIHPVYGEQFAFTSVKPAVSATREEILELLSSGIFKGLGEKTARLIVDKFGTDAIRIMDEEPERLQEIPGIGKKTGPRIAESYRKHRVYTDTAIFFEKAGISAKQAVKIYNIFGDAAINAVKENPYCLVDSVSGFGFRKADEIAGKLGFSQDSPLRIRSGILYVLHEGTGNGSTCLPKEYFTEKTAELLDLTREQVTDVLEEMAFRGDVRIDRANGEEAVYLSRYFEAEQKVAKTLAGLVSAGITKIPGRTDYGIALSETKSGKRLSETQRTAVKGALSEGVSVITGGPGTGKTTIIDAIITALEADGLRYKLAAPTGRAAKRMSAATGRQAQTVHRLLEYHYEEGTDRMIFGKTSEDPLVTDAVIIDEVSMIDLLLMEALLDAVVPGTRLVLVGDSDQLPSVGAGYVLHDIIESGLVRTFRLTEIFRQEEDSRIALNAYRINKGAMPELNGKNSDFFFLESGNDARLQELVIDLATRRLPGYYRDLDPVKDIQVITPVHGGPVGTERLNRLLQEAFNPADPAKPEKKSGDQVFRVGDKVMQIRNNYLLNWRIPGDKKEYQGVFNGDVGFVSAVDNSRDVITVIFDEEKYAEYDSAAAEELVLAYAITVHKSQGSEFPAVLMPVSFFPPLLSTRNLLYTAVTRGKRLVVLAGRGKALYQMIGNDRTAERTTGLRDRLGALVPLVTEP